MQGYADPINGLVLAILRYHVVVRQDVAILIQYNAGTQALLPKIPGGASGESKNLSKKSPKGSSRRAHESAGGRREPCSRC